MIPLITSPTGQPWELLWESPGTKQGWTLFLDGIYLTTTRLNLLCVFCFMRMIPLERHTSLSFVFFSLGFLFPPIFKDFLFVFPARSLWVVRLYDTLFGFKGRFYVMFRDARKRSRSARHETRARQSRPQAGFKPPNQIYFKDTHLLHLQHLCFSFSTPE